jgi:hypothetical protein
MRRFGLPGLAFAMPGLAFAMLVTACGGGGSTPARHPSSPTTSSAPGPVLHTLSVSPPKPTANSRVTFSFTGPATSGRHGPSRLSFALALAGPRRAGCLGSRSAVVAGVIRGRRAGVQLGGRWCVGAYVARVQEFARPFCKPGQMCPQYVRLIGTVASARFSVAAG